MSNKHNVIRQASFLMAATMICRVIGLLYRSPLHAVMGDIGDGYYSFAYEWYNIILLIASYSVPMAVSKVMAEQLAVNRYRNAQRIFYAALVYVLVVGGIGALLAFFGAPYMLFRTPGAVLALRVLAPTILLSGILGVFRGYFQARSNMQPTAVSQIFEQIINAIVSIGAAYLLTRPYLGNKEATGVYGAAGGTLGTGAGVVTAMIVVGFLFVRNMGKNRALVAADKESNMGFGDCFKTILGMVTPVILATCVYNLIGIVNQFVFTNMMSFKGMTAEAISSSYAVYGYQFKPIINIPIALASATSTALIPTIASLMAEKKDKEASGKINESISFMSFLAIPAAVGIAVLSLPIIRILYPGSNQGKAALMLTLGAVSVLFYCLSTVTNGVLQGLGKPKLPVRHSLIALAVDVVVVVVGSLLNMDIFSVLLATILYAVTVSLLNSHSVKKYIDYKLDLKEAYLKPLAASLIMGLVCGVLYWVPYLLKLSFLNRFMGNAIWTMIVVVIGVIVYFIAYPVVTGKTERELKRMPMGTRLVQVLKLLHIKVKQ